MAYQKRKKKFMVISQELYNKIKQYENNPKRQKYFLQLEQHQMEYQFQANKF